VHSSVISSEEESGVPAGKGRKSEVVVRTRFRKERKLSSRGMFRKIHVRRNCRKMKEFQLD